jgi:hypothetical protein
MTPAYEEGFMDAYNEVMDESGTPDGRPRRRDDPEYMRGWQNGMVEAMLELEYMRQEREYMDWRAGL